MDSPCIECLVSACCSKPCEEFAIYSYHSKHYKEAGPNVVSHIEGMKYDDAIKHILKVESLYFYMKTLDAPVAQ